jgi:hypothetical protein
MHGCLCFGPASVQAGRSRSPEIGPVIGRVRARDGHSLAKRAARGERTIPPVTRVWGAGSLRSIGNAALFPGATGQCRACSAVVLGATNRRDALAALAAGYRV